MTVGDAMVKPEQAKIMISNSESRQIIGVGRNYMSHCNELKNPFPKIPNFFIKASNSLIFPPCKIELPNSKISSSVQYEAEIAVIIGKDCFDVVEDEVTEYIAGVTVALDMTARDIQEYEKANQLSWCMSKSLPTFCPVCPDMISLSAIEQYNQLNVKLMQNGEMKQNAIASDMIFKIPTIVSYLSSLMKLKAGDIILTGTPAGVGQIKQGDDLSISLSIQNVSINCNFMVDQRKAGVVESSGIAVYPLVSMEV